MPSTHSRAVRVSFALTHARAALSVPAVLHAQTEKVDQAAMQKIRDEGFNRSKIMETASWLTDVYGPRLDRVPEHKKSRRLDDSGDEVVGHHESALRAVAKLRTRLAGGGVHGAGHGAAGVSDHRVSHALVDG